MPNAQLTHAELQRALRVLAIVAKTPDGYQAFVETGAEVFVLATVRVVTKRLDELVQGRAA